MGMAEHLARKRKGFLKHPALLRASLYAIILMGSAKTGYSAYYDGSTWIVSGGISYDDLISPDVLSQKTNGIASPVGTIGGRVQLERGLWAPDWSYWAEIGCFIDDVVGMGPQANGSLVTAEQTLTFFEILPLGLNYWLARTAFTDFHLSLGVGLGLLPTDVITVTPQSTQTQTQTTYNGGVTPIVEGNLGARFWLNRRFAINIGGGIRYYNVNLMASSGDQVNANLFSMSILAGVSYAIGGAKGVGRTFVDVIAPKSVNPRATPPGSPAPPTGLH